MKKTTHSSRIKIEASKTGHGNTKLLMEFSKKLLMEFSYNY